MIIEPTEWGLGCDQCVEELACDGAATENDVRAFALDDGWIIVCGWDFCSLDCLLWARLRPDVRLNMAAQTRAHMATHQDRCCRLHRTHATRGRHHWADCVDPKWAGVSVL